MTTLLPPHHPRRPDRGFGRVTTYRAGKKRRRRRVLAVIALCASALAWPAWSPAVSAVDRLRGAADGSAALTPDPDGVLPVHGQAAYTVSDANGIRTVKHQSPVPIASVAKVMTAYLVLRHHPLENGAQGLAIRFDAADVADFLVRRMNDESVIRVEEGERMSERQALTALLLPSANNIAAALAEQDAGSQSAFVAQMNATARDLGMTDTTYTDPSGLDSATVSTAADQVRMMLAAMQVPAFVEIVSLSSAWLPVAGTVHNTNSLVGQDGFVGGKTGSDDAAGGCFAFRAVRPGPDGSDVVITGVVLGQRGAPLIPAALFAARAMVDRVVATQAAR